MAVIKRHDQSQPGRKMFYFILQLSGHTPVITSWVRAKTQGKNLGAETAAEARRRLTGLFPMLSLPSYTITPTDLPTSQSCRWHFLFPGMPRFTSSWHQVSQRTIRVCVVCHHESTFSLAWVINDTTEGLPSVCKALGFIPSIAHLSYKR